MSRLKSVYIGRDVQKIEMSAFNCWQMKDVYYEGTEAEWNSISIGGWNNALTSATIHYNTVF